ncbi:MAG: GHKL domain-containing protein [Hungatella sp.]|nr:GHKL domain-containing protein [Hungatella sp.]
MNTDRTFYFQWYVILPVFLAHGVMPAVIFAFFCRYCMGEIKWFWCGLYVLLSACLFRAEYGLGMKGSGGLVLETVTLAWCGRLASKKGWAETFAVSVLILSVFCMTKGVISWADQRIWAPVVLTCEKLVYPSDGARELLKVGAVLVLFSVILRRFGSLIREGDKRMLAWLAVPLFFIAMVERIIQNSIYGDSLVTDQWGNVSSIIDIHHGEMLFLQIFACFCLFLTLLAHEKIVRTFKDAEKLKMVEQQAEIQKAYVQEAALRHKQTRAFRHDIKNHLMVLERLLGDNQVEEAKSYLSELKEASKDLSAGICTGNAAVDALLNSKLSLAGQEGIKVECDIKIPGDTHIKDMEWCILLSNGIDNAINACKKVPKPKRYLRIESKRKGNFYLITMENSCHEEIRQLPRDGIGLSNIRAVVEAYHGRVESGVSEGIYRLKMLFLDLQQEKAV